MVLFFNFTTSLSDAICTNFNYSLTITNSDGSPQSSIVYSSKGTSNTFSMTYVKIKSTLYSDASTTRIATLQGYINSSPSTYASSSFKITVFDTCLIANYVYSNYSNVAIGTTIPQSNMQINLDSSTT